MSDTWSVPVDAAAHCLDCRVVFAKARGVCPHCGSRAWIALTFYVFPRRGLDPAAAATPP